MSIFCQSGALILAYITVKYVQILRQHLLLSIFSNSTYLIVQRPKPHLCKPLVMTLQLLFFEYMVGLKYLSITVDSSKIFWGRSPEASAILG